MRTAQFIAGTLAACALAACGGLEAREVSLTEARQGVLRTAGMAPDALCTREGHKALRQSVRDYTAALHREGRPFEPFTSAVQRGHITADWVVFNALLAGQVKRGDLVGEAQHVAARTTMVAALSPRVAAYRALHRSDCTEIVAFMRDSARDARVEDQSNRRVARAMKRGDYEYAAQMRARQNRRERLADRSQSSFEREMHWMFGG